MGYVELDYKPTDDIVVLFRVEPVQGMTVEQVSEHVPAESSTGTWTEVQGLPRVKKIRARTFEINGNFIKVAYPMPLFEAGNIPQIMASIAGNIFGMKVVDGLRIEDIQFPKSMMRAYKGPEFGIPGIRKLLKVYGRPLCGTIIKPKLGLGYREHAQRAYEAWLGGCDIVKDDENLSNQSFNPFNKRIALTLKMKEKAERETGEKKVYMANVSAETNEMIKRAKYVKSLGGEYVMIDVLTTGFAATQTLRAAGLHRVIHAHRAMHGAFDRNKKHGIAFLALAKLFRLIGVDQLHNSAVVGKMEGDIEEVVPTMHELEDTTVEEMKSIQDAVTGKEVAGHLHQSWGKFKPTLNVCSGGLHPLQVHDLVRILGIDIAIQAGGGIHGHPWGSVAGATAMRQAIDAAVKGITLEEYAETHKELAAAAEKWKDWQEQYKRYA